MIYPMLHLHRHESNERSAIDCYVQPARIESIRPHIDGGSVVDFIGPDGGYFRVNESPDMIRAGIIEAITAQASASTKGAIQMQLAAQNELQRQQQSGIAIARGGIPPINGG